MSLQHLQKRISIKLIVFVFVCLFFIENIYAETIVINVGGGGPDNLKFIPQNVTAHKGDKILWKFIKGNHDVVESDGPGSCIESKKVNAFKSATNPLSGEFSIDITTYRDEITYMCMVGEGSHCANGMWGIITVVPVDPNSPVDNNDETAPPQNEKNNTGKIVGIVIGSVLCLMSISALVLWSLRRYRSKKTIKRTANIAEAIKQAEAAKQTDQVTKDEAKIVENV